MRAIQALAVAAAAAAATTTITMPAAAAGPDPKVDVVALGDSYAAGVGAGTEDGTCRRTAGAYAKLWAATDPTKVSLDLAACSGATTTDVLDGQLKALTADTDLVTVTVGSNDLGLVDALPVCADPNQAKACADALAKIKKDLTEVLPGRVGATLKAVSTQAPKAKIVVLGYPRAFTAAADCQAVPLSKDVRDAGNAALTGLDAILAAQAEATGAVYVDAAAAFDGHELCGASPWLIGVEGIGPRTTLHPTLEGQRAGYLAALTAKIGTPADVLAWIAQRDAPPSASASPSVSPTPGGAGGGTGDDDGPGLPLTGPATLWIAALGLVLVAGGTVAYRMTRAKTE